MHQEIEYFATPPDAIDPGDLSFYSRMIRHNPDTGKDELILYKNKPGIVGEIITDTVTFEDPEIFKCAIKQLEEIGTAVITGMGEIRHQHNLWNHNQDVNELFDKNEDESTRGRITCVLHLKNMILCPCEPKITKTDIDFI